MTDRNDDIINVANFIGWHDKADIYGTVRAETAFISFARLIDIEPNKLMDVVRMRNYEHTDMYKNLKEGTPEK
jgi:predicted oxidoreductase